MTKKVKKVLSKTIDTLSNQSSDCIPEGESGQFTDLMIAFALKGYKWGRKKHRICVTRTRLSRRDFGVFRN